MNLVMTGENIAVILLILASIIILIGRKALIYSYAVIVISFSILVIDLINNCQGDLATIYIVIIGSTAFGIGSILSYQIIQKEKSEEEKCQK